MITIKNNIKKFADIISSCISLNPEFSLNISNEELSIIMPDASKISLYTIKFRKEFFEEYNITESKSFSLKSDEFLKILKKFKTKLQIDISENKIKCYNEKCQYSINYMISNDEVKSLPVLDYSNEIIVKSEEFFSVIKDLTDFSSIVIFDLSDKFLMKTKNESIDSHIDIEFKKIKCQTSVAYYNSEYLDKLNFIKSIFDELKIEFSASFPCKLTAESEDLFISFVLAPRSEQ